MAMSSDAGSVAAKLNILAFVQGAVLELKKVTFLGRQETVLMTVRVLFIMILVALYLFILDSIFNLLTLNLFS